MTKVNELLNSRFKKKSDKMDELGRRSSTGGLSSFAGVFQVSPLSDDEQMQLRTLLSQYTEEESDISTDLKLLASITSEVKAINNQAAILHGERIKRAQTILKKYRDGAFSAWLISTYGNRQTPYNFLQYFELYTSISATLKAKVEEMPRQAVYTLATRSCTLEEKQGIIEEYKGQTKRELLTLIRQKFPLKRKDKRGSSIYEQALRDLKRIERHVKISAGSPTKTEKKRIKEVLQSIEKLL